MRAPEAAARDAGPGGGGPGYGKGPVPERGCSGTGPRCPPVGRSRQANGAIDPQPGYGAALDVPLSLVLAMSFALIAVST